MNTDLDFPLLQYLDKEADQEVALKELLLQHNLSYTGAQNSIRDFRRKYQNLLKKYRIHSHRIIMICYELTDRIRKEPANDELQFLYFCILTDRGVLGKKQQPGEQSIRNYITQQESVRMLTRYMETKRSCMEKIRCLKQNLRMPLPADTVSTEDFQELYEAVTQHLFLYGSKNNAVFRENLQNLNAQLNSSGLRSAKPYLLFALLTRKHGMMLRREHYIPNLMSALQYQNYQIDTDNGKNFDQYQSYLELYEHLRRFYLDNTGTDIPLCDFCFANLSPLSEWFYRNCQPELPIPKNLKQLMTEHMALGFPVILDYENYAEYDIAEFAESNPRIWGEWEQHFHTDFIEEFLDALYHGQDTLRILEQLPFSHSCPEYAALFLYGAAENYLAEKMLLLAEILE